MKSCLCGIRKTGLAANVLFALIFSLVSTTRLRADCGLHSCPVNYHEVAALAQGSGSKYDAATFQVKNSTRYAPFAIQETKGQHLSTALTVNYIGFKNWTVGLTIPFAYLDKGNDAFGFGNVEALVQYRIVNTTSWVWAVGGQFEAPTGDHESGIADSHPETLAYSQLMLHYFAYAAFVQFGWRQSLAGEHHAVTEEQVNSFVDPHGDTELVYRIGGGYNFRNLQITLRSYLELDQPTSHNNLDLVFAYAGIKFMKAIGKNFSMNSYLEVPITEQTRFMWRLGLGLTVKV